MDANMLAKSLDVAICQLLLATSIQVEQIRYIYPREYSVSRQKKKFELSNKIDFLDIKAETVLLLSHEVELRNQFKGQLTKLLREEEMLTLSTSNLWPMDGIEKQRIVQLEQDEGTIVGDNNLKTYITQYYKGLFGPHESIPPPWTKQRGMIYLKFQGRKMRS